MNDESRRVKEAGFRNAPDVGAFYFEDAAAALDKAGYEIGRVDFTLPPRQAEESAELTRRYNRLLSPDGADRLIADIPKGKYRVIRSGIVGEDRHGAPVFGLLVTRAREVPRGGPDND